MSQMVVYPKRTCRTHHARSSSLRLISIYLPRCRQVRTDTRSGLRRPHSTHSLHQERSHSRQFKAEASSAATSETPASGCLRGKQVLLVSKSWTSLFRNPRRRRATVNQPIQSTLQHLRDIRTWLPHPFMDLRRWSCPLDRLKALVSQPVSCLQFGPRQEVSMGTVIV